jgi:hypothetical protein
MQDSRGGLLDIFNYPDPYMMPDLNISNPMFTPKKHTRESYASQQRRAKKRSWKCNRRKR